MSQQRDRKRYGEPPMSYDQVCDALIARQQAAKPARTRNAGLSQAEIERRVSNVMRKRGRELSC